MMARRVESAAEAGMSLIEMVITVAVISIAFIAVLSGIGAMITSGALHRELTKTEAAARNTAEYVKSSDLGWVNCASSYDLTPLNDHDAGYQDVLPPGYTVSADTVRGLDSASAAAAAFTSAGCPTTDNGVQKVSVRVCPRGNSPCTDASPDRQLLVVVKRKAIT